MATDWAQLSDLSAVDRDDDGLACLGLAHQFAGLLTEFSKSGALHGNHDSTCATWFWQVRSTLRLEPAAAGELIDLARNDEEACGGLLGRGEGGSLTVTALRPCANHDDSARGFKLSLDELLQPVPPPLRLVGVYHTHPIGDDLEPSALDAYMMSLHPWVWLIAGATPRDGIRLMAYLSVHGRPTRLPCRFRAPLPGAHSAAGDASEGVVAEQDHAADRDQRDRGE
ncbi:MAG TPA: Mov34/MPN/PAD-1 family protein [Jatrophihabitans sp.]|nr:Mov34/MPN/PAD-1 family protein [Jatrophihabitans sp.]